MNKDLTVGSPSKVLWQFCLPMFGSILFQQLYNIADSLVAGKLIGENALAAVGNSYEITLIFLAFSFGCNIGGSVIVSRYFGAKDYNTMKTAVSTALIGTVVLCGALMAVGLLTPMVDGIAHLDPAVLIPWALGMAGVVLLFARLVSCLFDRHYSLAYHAVIGIVLASTLIIVPLRFASGAELAWSIGCAVLGAAIAYLGGRIRPKEEAET